MLAFCNPFRGRAAKFWIILVVALQLLFDLTIFLVYTGKPTSIQNHEEVQVIAEDAKGMSTINNKQPINAATKPFSRKPGPTQKPTVDMVNDYQPYVDFKFVYPEIQPSIEGPRDFYMAVLVNSGSKGDNFRRQRQKIRETWANRNSCEYRNAMNDPKLKDLKWISVFVLGKGEATEDKRNIDEAKQYNDMLIGNIEDNYLNNILKLYMGQLWASLHGAKYTLKTDDDVYVRIPRVIAHLVSESSPSRYYAGETYDRSGVARWAGGKWSVSKKYFPEPIFPPFNAGAFILMSTDLLGSLINYVYIRKPFHTDDAYVGVAMRDFKVKVVHLQTFDIKNDMAKLIHTKNDCEILKLYAYGHKVDVPAMQHLHERVEGLCKKGSTLQTCR